MNGPALSPPPASLIETIIQRAPQLGRAQDQAAAAAELVSVAGGDRQALVEARDAYVRRLHADTGDWEATAALAVLNRAIARVGWYDPYCWKGRRKP